MKMQFHHVGMACRRIAAELPELAVIGYVPEGPLITDPIQQVRIQFVTGGGPRIELIEPAGPQSPLDGVLKRGSKFYHLAYEVERLDEAVEHLKSSNFNPVAAPAPATAFGMRRIVFLASATFTLIELIESH
jgi:methylmalonyl-CoA/ethylmalonyl-CoA epimerase